MKQKMNIISVITLQCLLISLCFSCGTGATQNIRENSSPPNSVRQELASESDPCDQPPLSQGDKEGALRRVIESEEICPQWFAPAFRKNVPMEFISTNLQRLESELGPYNDVVSEDDHLWARYERGRVRYSVTLNSDGEIQGLWRQLPEIYASEVSDLVNRFSELDGQASVLIVTEGQEIASHQADRLLAVGSAFKLAVLLALSQAIEEGEEPWQDGWERVVQLDQRWISHPSGILQRWPSGIPITIHTLAALMISESDNTATDALVGLLGRDAVEVHANENRPLPTTRELAILESRENTAILDQYRAADEETRREILEGFSEVPLPSRASLVQRLNPDIRYRFTSRQLCSLMEQVHGLDVMSINPGLADPDQWQRVSFKGGGAFGVMNLTTWLVDESGQEHCVAATWNNPEGIEREQFRTLYGSLLGFLANDGGE